MVPGWKYYESGTLVAQIGTVSVREGKNSKTITPDLRLWREIVPGPKGAKKIVFKIPRRPEAPPAESCELEAPDGSRAKLGIEKEERGTITSVILERIAREVGR